MAVYNSVDVVAVASRCKENIATAQKKAEWVIGHTIRGLLAHGQLRQNPDRTLELTESGAMLLKPSTNAELRMRLLTDGPLAKQLIPSALSKALESNMNRGFIVQIDGVCHLTPKGVTACAYPSNRVECGFIPAAI